MITAEMRSGAFLPFLSQRMQTYKHVFAVLLGKGDQKEVICIFQQQIYIKQLQKQWVRQRAQFCLPKIVKSALNN